MDSPPDDIHSGRAVRILTNHTNTLHYMPIHKIGSSTIVPALRQMSPPWKPAWKPGSVAWAERYATSDIELYPDPTAPVIVALRDPVARYWSAVDQMMGHEWNDDIYAQLKASFDSGVLWTNDVNQHFWPVVWSLDHWEGWDFIFCELAGTLPRIVSMGGLPKAPNKRGNQSNPKIRERLLNEFSNHEDLILDYYAADKELYDEQVRSSTTSS